jgi:zinc transporter
MSIIYQSLLGNDSTPHLWTHIDAGKYDEALKELKNLIAPFDPSIAEALLEEETRPRLIQIDNSAVIILRGLNYNQGQDIEDMISIRIWISKNQITTVQRRQLQSIKSIKQRVDANAGPFSHIDFLCELLEELNNRLTTQYLDVEVIADQIEELLLTESSNNLSISESENHIAMINSYRRSIVLIKRFIIPQREAIKHLSSSQFTWFTSSHKRLIDEAHNDISRIIEEFELLLSRFQLMRDELHTIEAQRMNRHSHTLTIIASVFLPLTFLTGIMGMNVAGIPGSGSDLSFFILAVLFFFLILIQIYTFKKYKWF